MVALLGAWLTVSPTSSLGSWGKIGALVAIAILTAVALLDRLWLTPQLETMRKNFEKRSLARGIATGFSLFLARVAAEPMPERMLTDRELLEAAQPLEKSVPELMVAKRFKEATADELECIVVLWLAYYWTQMNSKPGRNALAIFHILDGTFRSSFPTLRFTDKSKQLMVAFKKMRGNWQLGDPKPPFRALFRGKLTTKEYTQLMFDFMASFGQQHYYQFMAKEKSELLRAHLIRIVREGRLSSRGLRQDVLERLQDEIRKFGASNDVFIVFKNKFYELDEYLEGLPHVKCIRAAAPKGLGSSEDARIYQIAVKTPRHYRDAAHFIAEEIRPKIHSKDGFLAAVPLNLIDSSVFPTQKDFSERQIVPAVAANYRTVNRLLTGLDRPDLDIWMLLAKHEVPVEETLANLPLTLLAENLTDMAANEVWSKDDKIKERFHIRTMTDWARVSPADLADYLSRNIVSLASMEFGALEDECRKIVTEAQRMHVSLSPLQESIDGEQYEGRPAPRRLRVSRRM